MRVLALDASLRCTGYAIFTDSKLVRWGCFNHYKDKDYDQRFCEMVSQISTLITKGKVDVVVVEDISLRCGNVKTLIALARLQGCIVYTTLSNDKRSVLYSPNHWRKLCEFVIGPKVHRAQLKAEAIQFIEKAYHLCNIGDDCAEAICIGLAYLKHEGVIKNFKNLKRSRKTKETEQL